MLKSSIWFWVFLCVPALAVADQLELSNGDTLQGKIVSMTDGTLLFNSPVLGELKIPMAKLKGLSSGDTIKLQLVNGDMLESVVSSETEGIVELALLDPLSQPQRISIDQIAGINPVAVKPVKWKGKLFVGANVETGNTEAQDIDIDIKATRETKLDRVIIDINYEEDRREDRTSGDLTTSKRYYALGGQYDYFTSERVYIYGDVGAEQEPTANLDQRIKIGTGAGYRWVETAGTRLEVESGLSWVSEEFTNNLGDDEYKVLRLAARLSHTLISDIDFFNDTEWLVSIEDQKDQLFSMDTGLSYRVNGYLSLEAKLHYDWDKSPSVGNDEDDLRYILGASWGF